MASPPSLACVSESIVLQTECVCNTAPAPRRLHDLEVQQRFGGRPPRAGRAPRRASSISRMSAARQRALVDGARRDREPQRLATMTALKLPLVPSTQPRA